MRGSLLASAALLIGSVTTAGAAEPSGGTIGGPGSKELVWTGSAPTPVSALTCVRFDPTCDHFSLTVEQPDVGLEISIDGAAGDDWDLFVYGPDGSLVASSASTGSDERVLVNASTPGTYDVAVAPYAVADGATYHGSAARLLGRRLDVEPVDCDEFVPAAAGVSGVTDLGNEVTVSVRVLLDGVTLERGAAIMARAGDIYEPLNIKLDPRFRRVSFEGTSSSGLLQQTKDYFHGRRPKGADVVYTITSKGLLDDDVVGEADCIGGVRWAAHAFAIGIDHPWEGRLETHRQFTDVSAEIAAHEIAHLLGAHHHYANCAEAVTEIQSQGRPSCTVMFNFVGFTSPKFSTLSGAVVRGHAVEYASP